MRNASGPPRLSRVRCTRTESDAGSAEINAIFVELLSASIAEVVRTHPELGRYSALHEAIEATATAELETRQDASHQALRMLCVTDVRSLQAAVADLVLL